MSEVSLIDDVRCQVRAFTDAAGEFFRPAREAFPDASEAAWQAARDLDPAAFGPDGSWRLQFRCFLVIAGGRTILVDAGVGPADAPAAAWAPVPGGLPGRLAEAGVDPAGIDLVVLSHLHADHVGWAAAPTAFPNARHVLQRSEHDTVDRTNPRLRRSLLDPLRDTGQLHLVDGRAPLAPGVRVWPAPGHTPGHQVVLVEHRDGTVAVGGDLLVHAVQLADPDVAYVYESDPETARRSRREVLGMVTTLGTAHLTVPFVGLDASRRRPGT